MHFKVATRETLRHNPLNAVTTIVERVTSATGDTRVRKGLRRPGTSNHSPAQGSVQTTDPWSASTDPRHWNYWQREADAYRSVDLRTSLQAAGLDLPDAVVQEHDNGATLWLEDVTGTPGPDFSLADHVDLAAALGRWQARGPLVDAPWASRGFLRTYSSTRPAFWHLVDDDGAWHQPLVRETWPAGLRDGWQRLLANRQTLLTVMENLPRTRSHLDFWVSNQIRRPTGPFVLLDWAFAGDGAVGEDLGNHVPDAVLDLFWPAERSSELDVASFEAYLSGLREADWRGSERDARLGVVASCVKYAWLLPRLLEQASDVEHSAYHQAADSRELYRRRGLALAHLVASCDEALRLL